jgi:hypothetical protein
LATSCQTSCSTTVLEEWLTTIEATSWLTTIGATSWYSGPQKSPPVGTFLTQKVSPRPHLHLIIVVAPCIYLPSNCCTGCKDT